MRIKSWSAALLAAGVAGGLTIDVSIARAQMNDEHNAAPKAPDVHLDAKTELGPGPMDLVLQFGAGNHEIEATSRDGLDELAVWLKDDPQHVVYIEAHPTEAARVGFDAKLGGERADAARAYLVAQGCAQGQVKVIPFGQRRPATAPNTRNERSVFLASAGTDFEGDVNTSAGIGATDGGVSEPIPVPEAPPAAAPMRRPLVLAPPPPALTYPEENDPSDDHLLTPFGMGLSVGAGLVGFIDDDANDFTQTGGTWEARLTVGTRSPVAFEAAYVGSAQNIDALGLDRSAILVGSSVEGDARLNLSTMAVQPYLFGGIGYTHYALTNTNKNTSSVNDSEDMGHIPLGAGIGFQTGGLLVDIRGTVRAAFYDDLVGAENTSGEPDVVPNPNDAKAELDTWNLGGRIGWEF